jgi:hypothetical protein
MTYHLFLREMIPATLPGFIRLPSSSFCRPASSFFIPAGAAIWGHAPEAPGIAPAIPVHEPLIASDGVFLVKIPTSIHPRHSRRSDGAESGAWHRLIERAYHASVLILEGLATSRNDSLRTDSGLYPCGWIVHHDG